MSATLSAHSMCIDSPVVPSATQSNPTPMVTSLSNKGTKTGSVSDVDQDDEYYILTEHGMNQPTVQLRRSTRDHSLALVGAGLLVHIETLQNNYNG